MILVFTEIGDMVTKFAKNPNPLHPTVYIGKPSNDIASAFSTFSSTESVAYFSVYTFSTVVRISYFFFQSLRYSTIFVKIFSVIV